METVPDEVEADGVRLDAATFRATARGTDLGLTRTEFRMLHALLAASGRVLTRDELVRAAYEGPHFVSDRTIDSHIRGVRGKLRDAGMDGVDTVNGVGWRWSPG